MAPRRVKVNKLDFKKLSANDVICPICRSILIKPITLPCNHGFCSACFESTQNSSVVCPLCRVRVGSWIRSATKSKKLINQTLWEAIQISFPSQVKSKLSSVCENVGAKHNTASAENLNKNGSAVKSNEKLRLDLKRNNPLLRRVDKINVIKEAANKMNLVPSSSHPPITDTSSLGKKSCKSYNQIISFDLEKNEKRLNTFLNNFATKEYTCRILCQNDSSKEKNMTKESQVLIQKKNKRIQEITQLEKLDNRSNSIESECLYFKPIDYRHNPPSKGLPPIKVPTRKPNVTSNIKILAPTGQRQINMNYLQSAFARLCSPMLSTEKEDTFRNENVNSQIQKTNPMLTTKRKLEKPECEIKAKKKVKSSSPENKTLKAKEYSNESSICDISKCRVSLNNSDVTAHTNIKRSKETLTEAELVKRSLQEKADFELATKLQQTFNQSYKYSTRSTALKRMATKTQVKMDEIMTPYKVK